MIIVGTTDRGYLAQISEEEIGVITGFTKYPLYGDEIKKREFFKATGRTENYTKIPTNTEIQVIKGADYLQTVTDKLKTARKTAKELRELADMLDNPLPMTIAPPLQEPSS